jgi:hypothetical protein
MSINILLKLTNTKFHENPSSDSRVSYIQNYFNTRFSTLRTRLQIYSIFTLSQEHILCYTDLI